jgi:hypothetical protein
MTNNERDQILAEARDNVERLRDSDTNLKFTEPVRDPRDRESPREMKRRHLHDIDQRIAKALEAERAVIFESVGSRLAELIDSQFPDLVDGSLRKTRDELSELKVEVARFTSVAEELRRALDAERGRTASGDVVSLPQRRQAH